MEAPLASDARTEPDGPPANALVTVLGGTGFVGRRLVDRLARSNLRVRVVARHHDGGGAGGSGDISRLTGSLTDPGIDARAVEGAFAVVNLVGTTSARTAREFYAVHCDGPARLAYKAAKAGVRRFVHFSAMGASLAAPSLADRSKAAGEAAVRAAFPAATIVRPALIFGDGDHFFTPLRKAARVSPAIPLIGGGRTRFEPMYVEDVVEALVRALASHRACGARYDLGNGEILRLRGLIEAACRAEGRTPKLVPLPFGLVDAVASLSRWVPGMPLVVDQVRLLKTDKVSSDENLGPNDLGMSVPLRTVRAYLESSDDER